MDFNALPVDRKFSKIFYNEHHHFNNHCCIRCACKEMVYLNMNPAYLEKRLCYLMKNRHIYQRTIFKKAQNLRVFNTGYESIKAN